MSQVEFDKLSFFLKLEFTKTLKFGTLLLMDHYIRDFYFSTSDEFAQRHFHHVIPLHLEQQWTWEVISIKSPTLCKGWFELAHLKPQDRIEFTQEFWLSKLPFNPKLKPFLDQFFKNLSEIGIFLVQRTFDDPYEPHMVYSLKESKGFFRGYPPAYEEKINQLKTAFPEIVFPEDYLGFLQIHNGFAKTSDTGLFSAEEIKNTYQNFQKYTSQPEHYVFCDDKLIDPKGLIPFYESFGQPFFQCFWTEWHHVEEMGNVYYSSATNSISLLESKELSPENMAFATFADWLMFYLEIIDA